MTTTAAKKPRKRYRTCRWLTRLDVGTGIIQITTGKRVLHTDRYWVQEIPCRQGIRLFEVRKWKSGMSGPLGGFEKTYIVRLSQLPGCQCEGFKSHGYCRHIQSLQALLAR